MERGPHDSEGDPRPLLPDAGQSETAEHQPAVVEIAFGHLDFVAPGGGRWDEWVISHGIINAVLDGRHIDDRTAYYIASLLATSKTPALRKLIKTGEIDYDGVRENLLRPPMESFPDLRSWTAWLVHYCDLRPDRRAVDGWSAAIRNRDRLEMEWWRRREAVAMSDGLFQSVPPSQKVGRAGQPGWSGLVRHDNRPGGWILTEESPEVRRVWETDLNEELSAAFVELVEAQRRWGIANLGRRQQDG